MTKTIALITIHGMGDTDKGYYTAFYNSIQKAVGEVTWSKVIFKGIYYQDILQEQQELIFDGMRKHIDWMRLRRFLLFGFSDAASLEYNKNVIDSPYFLTQKAIQAALDKIYEEAGGVDIPVIILAQSLGCQVMSSYIWDADPARKASAGIWMGQVADGSAKDNFRRMRSVRRFYTTGCNIPIFVSGHKDIQAIVPPNLFFKWHNFFDEDDVLGWPLKPLSPSYKNLVEDISINAGGGLIGTITSSWNPFSHGQYWGDSEVISHIASSIKQIA